MAQAITLNEVYEEIKKIQKNMITKEELDRIIETIEISSNEKTMEQIRESEKDIESGRVKEINSVNDIVS